MSPQEFADKRRGLSLTQKDLSRITGKKIGSIAAWENGRRPVPQIAVVVMEYLGKMKEPRKYCPPK